MSPLVSVHMVTFNQEEFIAKAIDSIISQKTDFPFELIIGEDCSLDNTREIVKQYANKYTDKIRLLISDYNIGQLKNSERVTNACSGKYIAYCEGDDYWTDPLKLQKQVKFLENRPEYGLIHSDFDLCIQKENHLIKNYNKTNNIRIPEGYIFEDILDPEKYIIKTVTACFKKEFLNRLSVYQLMEERDWHLDDLLMWLEISRQTKVKYIDESLAVYRILKESESNTEDTVKRLRLHRAVYDVRYYMIEKYDCSKEIEEKVDRFYGSCLLGDACTIGNSEIAKEAFEFFDSKHINPTIKDRINYFGAHNKILRKLLKGIKNLL